MKTTTNFPSLLEAFFTERLMGQRQASMHTIASYRDTFCLLFRFVQESLKKTPSTVTLDDLDAPFIGFFLDQLEKERNNCARTRNVRLAAIHSFFKYVALREPDHSALIQRVLAMPSKCYDRRPIDYLTQSEVEALLAAPDRQTWVGRRDRALLLLAVQTGLRVSELIGLKHQDIILGTGAHVRCRGKGRKERCTPLRKDTVAALRAWLHEQPGNSLGPLFPNRCGGLLSRDGVEYLLAKYVAVAQEHCPSLLRKRVSPHVLRHTTAMDLLHHGADRFVIALWLGHESVETTHMYVHADMKLKERVLAKTCPLNAHPGRYKPSDKLLAFLKGL